MRLRSVETMALSSIEAPTDTVNRSRCSWASRAVWTGVVQTVPRRFILVERLELPSAVERTVEAGTGHDTPSMRAGPPALHPRAPRRWGEWRDTGASSPGIGAVRRSCLDEPRRRNRIAYVAYGGLAPVKHLHLYSASSICCRPSDAPAASVPSAAPFAGAAASGRLRPPCAGGSLYASK